MSRSWLPKCPAGGAGAGYVLVDTGVFESAGLADWNAANGTDYPTRFTVTDYLDGEKIPEPTGGVLLELDSRNRHSTLTTAYHEPIGFADPENGETSKTLRAEIGRQIQTLEYALHSFDFVITILISTTKWRRKDTAITRISLRGKAFPIKNGNIRTVKMTESIIRN